MDPTSQLWTFAALLALGLVILWVRLVRFVLAATSRAAPAEDADPAP